MERMCWICEQTDDHPRHVIAMADGNDATPHMDCHASLTGCESCRTQTRNQGDARGEDFRRILTTQDGA